MALRIALLKFGTKFGPDFANRLARAVSANLSVPHEVVCVTDDPSGLDPAIRPAELVPFGPPREKWTARGNWPKAAMFAPHVFDDDDVVLYFDLDVLIMGSLDPFAELVAREGGMRQLREWNPTLVRALPIGLRPDRGGQGSILGWRMREQRHVWEHFTRNWEQILATHKGDRGYWGGIGWRPGYFPHDWVASFKRHCCGYTPYGLWTTKPTLPDWARVVVFHGRPEPWDLVEEGDYRWGGGRRQGRGPVPWVRDYWLKYGG